MFIVALVIYKGNHRFLRFYFSVFSPVKIAFDHASKHLKARQKCSVARDSLISFHSGSMHPIRNGSQKA